MNRLTQLWRYPLLRLVSVATMLAMILGFGAFQLPHAFAATHTVDSSSCHLNSEQGNIKHVIYIQFDNTHFTRDNPNVPSDLEQMPNLLNFMTEHGVLLSNHHTPLIAHTATDILTSLTGVYGDRHGVPISNTFRYFNPNGTSNPAVSFAYWTDPIYDYSTSTPTDTTYNMLTADGKNAPAPWVPYTRAGCNFGAISMANTALENIATDIPTVFGANSAQAAEVKSNPGQAFADFVGIAVHCARDRALCAAAHTGEADRLPDEPGGYTDYKALFGHKYVAPQISPNGPLTDLNGNVIQDANGHIGFPGFDSMTPAVSLAYVAAMQEHNIPVTYAYISDAHDNHSAGTAYGPGAAGYVAALKSYNDAFGKFFTRLANDGINSSNTLFVFTADEGDHFVGGAPSPANCNGVTIPCTYSQIGEINGNLTGLLATQQGITTPFAVHADSAPNFYITGNPARDNETITRPFERAVSKLTAVNPITGKTDTLTHYLADSVEMRLLHMVTADPARTPTFTMFADPNYYLYAAAPNCSTPCISEQASYAWNHGTVSPDINTTWLGMVGPGVQHLGVDGNVWSDHTDIRPTMLELLGLKDDYRHDGRVLFEVMSKSALPDVIQKHLAFYTRLAQVYKQLNAPVGALGLATLQISTVALESGNAANDSTYRQLESKLQNITAQRDALTDQMIAILEEAEFGGGESSTAVFSEFGMQQLITRGQTLASHAQAAAMK
ncbi:MAG: hypothetical protein NVSMB27_33760 [Ktedonobacteraceae bacterium]